MYKSKKQLKQKIEELEKENKILRQTLEKYNKETIIDTTKKSEQQELVEDLVQIITVFSCKLQGKRANKARKMVKELIEEGENNDKNIKSKT